jgi:hypothetical protein
MTMKKISYTLFGIMMLTMLSCSKNNNFRFDDFDYTTVYFPYQYPIRTLVLGDYSLDNSNDNQLKFLISARVGGLYENKKTWNVTYKVEESLALKLATTLNDTLKLLPSSYYTLNPGTQFQIPAGEFAGSVEVQLTDAFLNDPDAFKTRYVLPLRITGSSADSVLSGKPNSADSDPRVPGAWSVSPKNFTLFGIKFVNNYHGKYLHRGKSVVTTTAGAPIETIVYRQRYVEQDEVWSLQTTGRYRVNLTGVLRLSAGSPGNFQLELNFNNNGDGVVTQAAGSPFPVTGTAKFVKNGDEWGNAKRNAIYLNYQVTQGANKHTITDTLVFRDKDVRFQEFLPKIIN